MIQLLRKWCPAAQKAWAHQGCRTAQPLVLFPTQGNRNPKESHWVLALQTRPITPVCPVPSVPLVSLWASASSPYPDQVGGSDVSSWLQFTCREPNSPSENWGLPLLHSAPAVAPQLCSSKPLVRIQVPHQLGPNSPPQSWFPRPFHLSAQDSVENASSSKPASWVFASQSFT